MTLELTPSGGNPTEGEAWTLTATRKGKQTAAEDTIWLYSSGGEFYAIARNGKSVNPLSIEGLKQDHSGHYKAIVGDNESKPYRLAVEPMPEPPAPEPEATEERDRPEHLEVTPSGGNPTEGEAWTLTATRSGDQTAAEDTTWLWSAGGGVYSIVRNGSSVNPLSIERLTQDHSGHYKAIVGDDESKPYQLAVEPMPEPPAPEPEASEERDRPEPLEVTPSGGNPTEGDAWTLTATRNGDQTAAEDTTWLYSTGGDVYSIVRNGSSVNPLSIEGLTQDHSGHYKAIVGDNESKPYRLAVETMPEPPAPEPRPIEELGAYSQFETWELLVWGVLLLFGFAALSVVLWATADNIGLLSSRSDDGLANLMALFLVTAGLGAFALGVLLQLASLRVARHRRSGRGGGELAALGSVPSADEVEGIVKALGAALRSVKAPLAAVIAGVVLMVTAGLVARDTIGTEAPLSNLCAEFETQKDALAGSALGADLTALCS